MANEGIPHRIDRLLGDAQEAVVRRDWQAVLDIAQQVLTIDPDNRDAQAFVPNRQVRPQGGACISGSRENR